MRASTLFILVIAILLGVGTVFAVNHYGLLNRKSNGDKKEELPYVFVAQRNLFQNIATTTEYVKVRQLNADEFRDVWPLIKTKVLPPMVEAAHLRVLKRNVAAGTILLQEHFEDLKFAPSLIERLEPDHVAIYLSLPKDQASGGIIQKDERVDIIYFTQVCYTADCRNPEQVIAPIAQNLRIIAKRDNLFTIMAPVGDKVSYHVEANHYRAALIEFAKRTGVISMVPSAHRSGMGGMPPMDMKEEAHKSLMVRNNQMRIGKKEMMEVLGIKERQLQAREPRPSPHVMQIIRGVTHGGYLVFPPKMYPPTGVGTAGETREPPTSQLGPGGFSVPTGASYFAEREPAAMDEPMEAFGTISFRQPDNCSDLPNSSKKG